MAVNPVGKVLRLGVIQGGKIIEDRTLDKRESVSLGNDGKNTVVVPMSNLPRSLTVFELKGQQYSLCFTEGMEGKLSVGGSGDQLSFAALKSQGLAKKRGDLYVMPLSEAAKGKLSLGEVTLLFQFVNPPKAAAKMELPKAAKGSLLNTIDRTFTAVLMFFLIIEFAGIGLLSSMPLPNEDVSLEALPDRFVKMVVPEKKAEPPKPKQDASKVADAKKADKKMDEEKKKIDSTPKDTAEHKAAVAKAVASKGLLKMLGSQGGLGSGIADVFGDGSASSDVANALAGASGVQTANGDNVGGTKGGGSGKAAGIGDLGTKGGGAVSEGTKRDVGVRGRVMDSTPDVESSDLDKAALARFIHVRLSAIKACYDSQLKRDPKLHGKIVVRFTVGTNGRISDIEIDENEMGNDEVAACIKAKMRAWSTPFRPSDDATVSYPFIFEQGN